MDNELKQTDAQFTEDDLEAFARWLAGQESPATDAEILAEA